MFHHLLTEEEQDISFKEMLRVMKTGAIGILTCWATEQPFESKFKFHEGVNIVLWKGKEKTKTRYYYVYSE